MKPVCKRPFLVALFQYLRGKLAIRVTYRVHSCHIIILKLNNYYNKLHMFKIEKVRNWDDQSVLLTKHDKWSV